MITLSAMTFNRHVSNLGKTDPNSPGRDTQTNNKQFHLFSLHLSPSLSLSHLPFSTSVIGELRFNTLS